MTDRKKPGVAFWATVLLVALLDVYTLSFGPACWWFTTATMPDDGWFPSKGPYAPRIYWPFGWLSAHGPQPVRDAINWYATRRFKMVMLPCDWTGNMWQSSN
jgi:hypothetical protein